MPRRVAWPADPAEQEALTAAAAELLLDGQVIAFPTDTVYGLAAHPSSEHAMDSLYALKGRAREKAIALLVADSDSIGRMTLEAPLSARALAERFWPGGLTLVLRSAADPSTTVALRMPNHPIPLAIIRAAGSPLATTSANRSAAASPRTANEVLAQLPTGYPMLIDGGPCPGGTDSTVLDMTSYPPRILRPGALSREALEAIAGPIAG